MAPDWRPPDLERASGCIGSRNPRRRFKPLFSCRKNGNRSACSAVHRGPSPDFSYRVQKVMATYTQSASGHLPDQRQTVAATRFSQSPRPDAPTLYEKSGLVKGKVERPFSHIRQDFFLGRNFRNLDDLNAQLIDWLDAVANIRIHATTQQVIAEAFAAEQPELQTLPQHRLDAVLETRTARQSRRLRRNRRELLHRARPYPSGG